MSPVGDTTVVAPRCSSGWWAAAEAMMRAGGTPPFRIEVMTTIDGVEFDACAARADVFELDDLPIPVIALADLKTHKMAAGRHKDLADLENLP